MSMLGKNKIKNRLNLFFCENKDFSNFLHVLLGRVFVPLPYIICSVVKWLQLTCIVAYAFCIVAYGFCTFAFYVLLPMLFVLLPMVFVSLVNDIVFLPNDFVLLQGDTNGL